MNLKLLSLLGVMALGACNTTHTAQVAPVETTGAARKLTQAQQKQLRCQQKQQNAASAAVGASVIGAGASTVAALAAPSFGWGGFYGGDYGLAVAGSAVAGISQVAAQAATNQQIEAAMGHC